MEKITDFYKNTKPITIQIETTAIGFCAMPYSDLVSLIKNFENKDANEILEKGIVYYDIGHGVLRSITISFYDSIEILPHEIFLKGEHGGHQTLIDFKSVNASQNIGQYFAKTENE